MTDRENFTQSHSTDTRAICERLDAILAILTRMESQQRDEARFGLDGRDVRV
ncbi:hypothetical protein [Microbacterium sp. Marseille-Q6965]|uniref:hypothetical protein n=1 Tax=Microbacterium sp. Marseille-Q6965 TaxID=2965072 RepID=UPI0021B7AD54|nr:hypothetical protein [Microbacterium sp. Marseille-Q6965]